LPIAARQLRLVATSRAERSLPPWLVACLKRGAFPFSFSSAMNHRVEIIYCTKCRWLLRAAWMAQELLTTFEQEIGELGLKPGTGGIFEVHVDGALIWSRKESGRFPDIAELKQLVRDRVAPGRDLGHVDRKSES
jgi:selenoprotein W-related protein